MVARLTVLRALVTQGGVNRHYPDHDRGNDENSKAAGDYSECGHVQGSKARQWRYGAPDLHPSCPRSGLRWVQVSPRWIGSPIEVRLAVIIDRLIVTLQGFSRSLPIDMIVGPLGVFVRHAAVLS